MCNGCHQFINLWNTVCVFFPTSFSCLCKCCYGCRCFCNQFCWLFVVYLLCSFIAKAKLLVVRYVVDIFIVVENDSNTYNPLFVVIVIGVIIWMEPVAILNKKFNFCFCYEHKGARHMSIWFCPGPASASNENWPKCVLTVF